MNRAMRAMAAVPIAIAAATGLRGLRRWHLRWGASDDEVAGPMPGDEHFPQAQFSATRAITIDAPPERVWPWLVQVGFGRAGFYSYDLLDNLGRSSAGDIVDALQHPVLGDWVPMTGTPTPETAFRFALIDPPRALLWLKPQSSWAWALHPAGDRQTRLVTRLRSQYSLRDRALPLTVLLMEVADFPMMRRMLLRLKARAEQHGADGPGRTGTV